MRPPHLADRGLDLGVGLGRMPVRAVRPVREPFQALFAIPADPAVHRLPRDPEPLGYLGHRHPGLDLEHGSVPLLRHGQLHQHSAECHASTGTDMSRIKRSRTPRVPLTGDNFLYVFKPGP
jgi:hypothetical protein